MQLEQLRALIEHAYENVPYYRRVFDERRLKPKDVSNLEDLQKLPLLTKEGVRSNFEDLIARNIDPSRFEVCTTGGSTGKPLALYVDKHTAAAHELAFIRRQWDWAGYRFGDRFVTLRGNVIHRLDRNGKRAWWDCDSLSNELVLSSFGMDEENMHKMAEMIRAFKPRFIQAYPASLEVLGRFARRNRLEPIKVKAVFLESETVYPWQREIIESQFSCEIFAAYGMTERVADAIECEQHQGYHVCMEYGVLELVDKSENPVTRPGTLGRVIGTGFDNYCMPLIRYATDDLATYAAGQCSCKRELTLIGGFKGRIREFIVSRARKRVPLTALNLHSPIFEKIRELRYIQEREGELIAQIARVHSFSEADIEQEFRKELHERLDINDFNIKIVFADHLPRTERGKIGLLEQRLPIDFRDLERI